MTTEQLCECKYGMKQRVSEQHIRRVERRARMRWTCVMCRKPILPPEVNSGRR